MTTEITETAQVEKPIENWRNAFDERQLKEIDLSILYARDFRHGTDGHNAKMIIAKLVELLTE